MAAQIAPWQRGPHGSRSGGRGRTVARLLELGAADAVALQADVTRTDEVNAAFARVRDRWGQLNIVVNATGPTGRIGRFEELSDEDWLATVDVGAMGMVRCVRAALPLLRAAEWARIAAISADGGARRAAATRALRGARARPPARTR